MKNIDLIRPDKLLLKGFRSLGTIGSNLYSNQKTEAKAKAQLTFIGKKKVEKVESQLFAYSLSNYGKNDNPNDYSFINAPLEKTNYWLNFHGVHEIEIIEHIGKQVNLDRLTVRQILDTTQRSKVEEYDEYLFFSLKSILKESEGDLKVEHLSFVLGSHFVISFQEEVGDHFEGIRNKLIEGLGFIRQKNSDYLLQQLIDAIIDNYFETIDKINTEIAHLENEVLTNPDQSILIALERHKRSAQVIKKALSPIKEALLNIVSSSSKFIQKKNMRYFNELTNSATAALEEIDSTLKTLEGLTNIYFASFSHRMNETMKVLTTVATVFIPLTFIAGIYGMNFDNMPELHTKNGYFIVWGVMISVATGMGIYFKRKKWM